MILRKIPVLLGLFLFANGCSVLSSNRPSTNLDKFKTVAREPYPYRAPSFSQHSFLAGASKIEITPPKSFGPLLMAGYYINREEKGIHDPLWARCAAVTDPNGNSVVLVSLDLLGFWHEDVQEVRRRVALFANTTVIIASTHTHSGPDTIGLYGYNPLASIPILKQVPLLGQIPFKTGRNDDYVRFVQNQIVACVGDALEDQREALLYVSTQKLRGLTRNLREPSVLDNSSFVLYARDRIRKETVFFLHNFGVHPEIMMSNLISSDFLDTWYRENENNFGGTAIFLNGSLGALVSPEVPNLFSVDELPNQVSPQYEGRVFTRNVFDAWGNAVWFGKRMNRKLVRELRFEEVKPQTIHFRNSEFRVALENNQLRTAYMLGLFERPDYYDNALTTEVGLLSFGSVGFVFFPGETPPQLGIAVRNIAGTLYKHVALVSLANDEIGYLLNNTQAQNPLYAYERMMCVNPRIAEILTEEFQKLIPR